MQQLDIILKVRIPGEVKRGSYRALTASATAPGLGFPQQWAMRPLLESARSDRPIIELADAKQLFSTLPEMHKLHNRFLVALQERVDELTPTTLLGDLLGGLVQRTPPRTQYTPVAQAS